MCCFMWMPRRRARLTLLYPRQADAPPEEIAEKAPEAVEAPAEEAAAAAPEAAEEVCARGTGRAGVWLWGIPVVCSVCVVAATFLTRVCPSVECCAGCGRSRRGEKGRRGGSGQSCCRYCKHGVIAVERRPLRV